MSDFSTVSHSFECCQHAVDTIMCFFKLYSQYHPNNSTRKTSPPTSWLDHVYVEKPTSQKAETHWDCWSSQTRSHTWCRGRWLKPGANQSVAAFPGTNSTVKSLLRYCSLSHHRLVKVEQTCKPGATSARLTWKTQGSVYLIMSTFG